MQPDISVLLMDDEPMSPIIQATVQILRQEGFHLDLVESVAQAVESYYQRFYDVFVLDIDMNDTEGDGLKVLKRFISLHNQTQVIMFSGAGTTPDWFEAANAHCFAYVAKDENDAIDLLIGHIRAATGARRRFRSAMRRERIFSRIRDHQKDWFGQNTAAVFSLFPDVRCRRCGHPSPASMLRQKTMACQRCGRFPLG